MKIQILGSGCPACKKLYEMTKVAISANDLSIEVEYITDVQKMIEMGLMQSPSLVIDGKIVAAGRVPSGDELREIIAKHKE